MRKISVILICFIIFEVSGCSDNSGDPTSRITLTVDLADGVEPGGNAIVTATVTRPDSDVENTTNMTTKAGLSSAWGEKVTFKLLTTNGASLNPLVRETDGNGIATTVYTAGNNYTQDVVEATLENGMSASIVIRKTGIMSGARISVTADPSSVKASCYSSIEATVTDGNDDAKPIAGETVEFSLIENNSGATLIKYSTMTDSAGQAMVIYKAGEIDSVQDVIQAKVTSSRVTDSVIIQVTP